MSNLTWHKGRHAWGTHDGYPRHQHSINGVLTIAPRDNAPHFAWGPPFAGEERKTGERPRPGR